LPSPKVKEIALGALGSDNTELPSPACGREVGVRAPYPLVGEGMGMRGHPPSPLALPREGGGGVGENLHVGWGEGELVRISILIGESEN